MHSVCKAQELMTRLKQENTYLQHIKAIAKTNQELSRNREHKAGQKIQLRNGYESYCAKLQKINAELEALSREEYELLGEDYTYFHLDISGMKSGTEAAIKRILENRTPVEQVKDFVRFMCLERGQPFDPLWEAFVRQYSLPPGADLSNLFEDLYRILRTDLTQRAFEAMCVLDSTGESDAPLLIKLVARILLEEAEEMPPSAPLVLIEPPACLIRELVGTMSRNRRNMVIFTSQEYVYNAVLLPEIKFYQLTEEINLNAFRSFILLLLKPGMNAPGKVEKLIGSALSGKPRAKVMVLDADREIEVLSSSLEGEKEGAGLQKVWTLPAGLPNESLPARKMLAVYSLAADYRKIEIRAFSKVGKGNDLLYRVPHARLLNQLPEGEYRREFYQYFRKVEQKSERKRQTRSVELTPEIVVYYNLEKPKENGRVRVDASMKIAGDSQRISGTQKAKIVEPEQIIPWLSEDYPFLILAEEKAVKLTNHIWDRITRRCSLSRISYGTVYYLFSDKIESGVSKKGVEYLRRVALPLLKDIPCRLITAEKIEAIMCSSELDAGEVYHYFSSVFRFMASKSLIGKNPMHDLKKYENKRDPAAMRRIFGKKYLTKDETNLLFRYAYKRLNEASYYLAFIIKLFTGLDSSIISALTWKDFKQIDTTDFYHLAVCRYYSVRRKKVLPLESREDYRYIPCIDLLSRILCRERDRQQAAGGLKKEEITAYPIIRGDTLVEGASGPICLPESLTQHFTRQIIQKVGVVKTAQTINLGQGYVERVEDTLRSLLYNSFEHFLGRNQVMEECEKRYLLGTINVDTMSRHYIDFANCRIQEPLLHKMNAAFNFISLEEINDGF